MATDFDNPTLTSTYTNFLAELKARDESLATMFRLGTEIHLPENTIRWSSGNNRFEIWTGGVWAQLTSMYNINADKLDGYHAGNSAGDVPINNGTVCSTLNADKLDGYHAGNSAGDVPINNGTVCSTLNADKLDGEHAAYFAPLSTLTAHTSATNPHSVTAAQVGSPTTADFNNHLTIHDTYVGANNGSVGLATNYKTIILYTEEVDPQGIFNPTTGIATLDSSGVYAVSGNFTVVDATSEDLIIVALKYGANVVTASATVPTIAYGARTTCSISYLFTGQTSVLLEARNLNAARGTAYASLAITRIK